MANRSTAPVSHLRKHPIRGPAFRRARLILPAGALALLVLLGAACGGNAGTPAGSGKTDGVTASGSPITATLNASGATFPMPFYETVIGRFKSVQPNITINYAGGGSGKGRQELAAQVVDFAGSDGLVKPEDRATFKGGEFLYFPTVTAPVTVSYNLADVKALKLDATTIARIFQRQITRWNDPAIKSLNSGANLPSTPITVAHRSDGSGTTENFTKYLVAAAPDAWKLQSGSTVEWPKDTQAGNGNQGVAQIVKTTPGAVGYVDLSDAKASGLQFAMIKNKAGKVVSPTLQGAAAAAEGAQVNDDLSYNPLNAGGPGAYPITAPTWILAYKNQTDKTKGRALQAFLSYLLNDGQKLANSVDYAPLPDSLRQKAISQIERIVLPA